jgi:hypothetical protein
MLLNVVCLLLCYITLSDFMDGGVAMYNYVIFFLILWMVVWLGLNSYVEDDEE